MFNFAPRSLSARARRGARGLISARLPLPSLPACLPAFIPAFVPAFVPTFVPALMPAFVSTTARADTVIAEATLQIGRAHV